MFNLMFLAVYETLSIIRTDGALFSHFLHTNTHRKEKKILVFHILVMTSD